MGLRGKMDDETRLERQGWGDKSKEMAEALKYRIGETNGSVEQIISENNGIAPGLRAGEDGWPDQDLDRAGK